MHAVVVMHAAVWPPTCAFVGMVCHASAHAFCPCFLFTPPALQAWCAAMPRVVPFYAIKCNPDPGVVRLLAALGAGFDCASLGEVQQVLDLGVSPSRIIFAHPCKRPCDIRYAREHGVGLTTFDTESELVKIANFFPGFKCVLRIRADDPEARVPLGLKYGANPEEAPKLLATAQRLGLDVVGVSFHVGSACKNLAAYSSAIEKAREVGGGRLLVGTVGR